jgi:hypothetical protein
MTADTPTPEGELSKLIDEQLELAAAKIPALVPTVVHPSPVDHEERQAAHATLEDVLLGNAVPTPEMLEELAALETAPELSEEELARQALADGGADAPPQEPLRGRATPMNDETLNLSIRKFLKTVGVNSQREIEQAVASAMASRTIGAGRTFPATMRLQVPGLQLDVSFDGEIRLE